MLDESLHNLAAQLCHEVFSVPTGKHIDVLGLRYFVLPR
jgi:hypothetical protein